MVTQNKAFSVNAILVIVIIVLLIIVLTGGYFLLLAKPETSKTEQAQDITVNVKSKNDLYESPLSEDASYPSPVQQLQQTVAYGLVNQDAPDLPLLKGELAQFSQDNIKDGEVVVDIGQASEIHDLKQRLEALNTVLSTKNSNE
ncbi:hypothetical protein Q4491_04680 [Photobacterium sp. 2_MG-2023]|uniref:hypothetical protein n=1 Tax=Photobacterium sp. 2_MG-2023 TaxID=3062663 RepID=UPI0026E1C3CF|nr:hypothetical protein [Photobacterium sp. 2_MG-2023]MDO6580634.1 hypothetical protein [Photobacterium sp. 2_MG-2023]